jgi:hypothetical protein
LATHLVKFELYEGLPIDAQGSAGQSFNRSQFVEVFKQENYGRVCPFCDGDRNGPQVDHWLPKSKYPALSCHPKNLVPICYRCNALEKGEKVPLDTASPQPFDNWFHPYERAAYGHSTVTVDGTHVSLTDVDPVQQSRLNNFDQLVKLTQRWWEEYKSQKRNYLNQLRERMRRGRSKPTAEDILDTVQSWLEDIAAERTLMPHSIMRRVVLERVQTTRISGLRWLAEACGRCAFVEEKTKLFTRLGSPPAPAAEYRLPFHLQLQRLRPNTDPGQILRPPQMEQLLRA